jgi:tetratricopeptide (TPR) repeat protein
MALHHIRQLDIDTGTEYLQKALAKDPEHITALTHLYNARKADPQDPRFHDATRALLSRLTRENAHHKSAAKIFSEYTRLTQRPRLSSDLYFKMISVLTSLGYPEKAEGILKKCIKQKPDSPGIPNALLKPQDIDRRVVIQNIRNTCRSSTASILIQPKERLPGGNSLNPIPPKVASHKHIKNAEQV